MTKIYDCVLFDGRVDLLERRLRELTGEVFAFVIVEVMGEDKGQPQLRSQWRRIKQFARQIRYVVVCGSNSPASETQVSQRFAENLPRGLMDANADDVVLISDIGSIPEIRLVEHAEATGHQAFVFHATNSASRQAIDNSTNGTLNSSGSIGFKSALLEKQSATELCQAILNGVRPARHYSHASRRYRRSLRNFFGSYLVHNGIERLTGMVSGWNRAVAAAGQSRSKSAPVVICPYLGPAGAEQVASAFGTVTGAGERLEFYYYEDTGRLGPERAYQHCWNRFPGRDVIIIHTDMKPMPDDRLNHWYDQLLHHVEALPDAGIVACDLLFPVKNDNGLWCIQSAGGRLDDGLISHIGSGVDVGRQKAGPRAIGYDDSYRHVREVEWATFGGVYIRREALDMCGSFDERYKWAYVMDVDYCLEIRRRGMKIYQVPVNLLHAENGTTRQYLDQKSYSGLVAENHKAFYLKWDWYLKRFKSASAPKNRSR